MNQQKDIIRDARGFGYAENAAAWSAAYVRYVRSDNSCTDSGKQLFSEYLTGIVRTGDIVLCRIRYLVFPSVYQI